MVPNIVRFFCKSSVLKDTEPRVQLLCEGSYLETGMGPQGLAGAGLSVLELRLALLASFIFMSQRNEGWDGLAQLIGYLVLLLLAGAGFFSGAFIVYYYALMPLISQIGGIAFFLLSLVGIGIAMTAHHYVNGRSR